MTLTCSICQSDISTKPIEFCCNQSYHFDCIFKWVKETPKCPICRKDLTNNTVNLLTQINESIEEVSSLTQYTCSPLPYWFDEPIEDRSLHPNSILRSMVDSERFRVHRRRNAIDFGGTRTLPRISLPGCTCIWRDCICNQRR
jgi:hypothetical protein